MSKSNFRHRFITTLIVMSTISLIIVSGQPQQQQSCCPYQCLRMCVKKEELGICEPQGDKHVCQCKSIIDTALGKEWERSIEPFEKLFSIWKPYLARLHL